ncbi:MAG: 4Fe-4S dicluster domain-containing protein [Dehalococcoidia bacterium]|nr:4Fe-4S dicluster domain-containing protein [Dehalococcoidia bacterium]
MTIETKEMKTKMIPIFVMGKRYEVPETLTIMKAMEYAGFKFIRGCGCRGGICGACATVYGKAGDYKLYSGLACQTVVEPNMYLTQVPFYPANRAVFDYSAVEAKPEEIFQLYPELFRCVACNSCTKVCPMDVEVMDAIAQLKRGNIARAAEMSFSCIQCGLCTSRCMGELPQYHIFQLARRIYGGLIAPRAQHLQEAVKIVASGRYEECLQSLMKAGDAELRKLYQEREMEPEMTGEDWTPKDKKCL